MSDLVLDIDFGKLLAGVQSQVPASETQQIETKLAEAVYLEVTKQAKAQLNSRQKPFLENCILESQKIKLTGPAVWIDQGLDAFDMKESLGSGKNDKVVQHGEHSGQKYRIVPFEHNKSTDVATALEESLGKVAQEAFKRAFPRLSLGRGKEVRSKIEADHPDFAGDLKNFAGSVPRSRRRRQWMKSRRTKFPAHLESTHPLFGKAINPQTGEPFKYLQGLKAYRQKGQKLALKTFRVMGEWQSDMWLHPGIEGEFLVDRAVDQVIKDGKVKDIVMGILGET